MMDFLVDVAWQTTALLAAGLLLSIVVARRPARAHAALALVVIAALVLPLVSALARDQGWGWLPPRTETATVVRNAGAEPARPFTTSAAPTTPADVPAATAPPTNPSREPARSRPTPATPAVTPPVVFVDPTALLPIAWSALSMLVLVTLALRMRRETRLVRAADPLHDDDAHDALARAIRRTGVARAPALRRGPHGAGITIWCWSRPPAVLVAPDAGESLTHDGLDDVLCHELAHARRGDHWWALLGHALIVLLPWNPLAWLAAGRLRELAERACDQWVLAAGAEPGTYANLLVDLVASPRATLSLPARGTARRLRSRIACILEGAQASGHRAGAGWLAGALVLTVVVGAAVACARPRPAATVSPRAQATSQPAATSRPAVDPASSVISTDAMRQHLVDVHAALEGMRVEYTKTQYRGASPMPDDWARSGILHIQTDGARVFRGQRFRLEGTTTAGETRYGYQIGGKGITTWDGVSRRDLSFRPEPLGDYHGDAQWVGSIDASWDTSESDQLERYLTGIAVKADRVVPLYAMFDHESLLGPFGRDDGRTEWRVRNPEEWQYLDVTFESFFTIIGERHDGGVRLAELVHDFTSRQGRATRRYVFSPEPFRAGSVLPAFATKTDQTAPVGRASFWFAETVVITDLRPEPETDDTYHVAFPDGTSVHDGRYGIGYTVGERMIGIPRERNGYLGNLTEPVRGDVGADLGSWLAKGTLVSTPAPRADWVAIGTPDLDLPPERRHDFGEEDDMNWGSGHFHVFDFTNDTDHAITIASMTSTGKSIDTAWLGYDDPEDNQIPGGFTGVGTTIEPGASVPLYVSMQHGIGLWRHALTLSATTGESWSFQLSATGIVTPKAGRLGRGRAFLRAAPEPGSRVLPFGVLLLALEKETEPLVVVEPADVRVIHEEWLHLVPFHFRAGSPLRQIGHFRLDLSAYDGPMPVAVNLRTASGVDVWCWIQDTMLEAGRP